MPTKNGVYYDLRESPYAWSWDTLTFYFSSAKHLNKFKALVDARVEWMCDSMSRRFHVAVDAGMFAALQLYMQVETRGFLVHDAEGNRWYDCPGNITLHGPRISAGG